MDGDMLRTTGTGQGYIEHPMGKARPPEEDPHALESLALSLVNCHGERHLDGKLVSRESERVLNRVGWPDLNLRDHFQSTRGNASEDSCDDEVVHHNNYNHSGSVCKAA